MKIEETRQLFENFINNYDLEKSRKTWEKQSNQFKNFWKDRIMSEGSELTEEELQPIIRILDRQAKGIRSSGVEPACKPMGITQNRWYKLFRDIKEDDILKVLMDKLFNSDSDDQQVSLINKLYADYKNPLTNKTANILNDVLFVYNPMSEISIVSLSHRYQIIDFFNLGKSEDFEILPYGEKVIYSRNIILEMKKKLGLNVDNRVFSMSFYGFTPEGKIINDLWIGKKTELVKPKKTKNILIQDKTVNDQISVELDEIDTEPVELELQDRKIYSDKNDRTIFELSLQSKRGRLKLDPEFQRYYIWDDTTASKLVESVFMEIPIPIIYLSEESDGKYSVIDGHQRLRSLFRFIDNDLKLNGLQVFKELNGKNYQDLDSSLQNKFENYSIRTIEIRKESHSAVKFEIFERLNRGSFKLNDQELRNCIYRGKYNSLLKELASDGDFMFLLGLNEPHKRMFDRELVLRFCSFYHNTYLKYKPPMKQFFNNDMEKYKDLSSEHENELRNIFKKSVQFTKMVFGNNAFKRFMPGSDKDNNGLWEKRKLNQALYDIVMFGFTQYDKNQIVPFADSVREELLWLMTHDSEFIDSILIGTSGKDKVFIRFEKWIHSLKEILGAPKTEKRIFSLSIKEQLFNTNHYCAICNQTIYTIDDSEVDHVKFYWRGGKTILPNARLVHRYCNRARNYRI